MLETRFLSTASQRGGTNSAILVIYTIVGLSRQELQKAGVFAGAGNLCAPPCVPRSRHWASKSNGVFKSKRSRSNSTPHNG